MRDGTGTTGEQAPGREEEEQGWTLSPAGGGGHGGGGNDAAAIEFGEPDDYFAAHEARKHKTRTLVRELVETGLLALLVFLAVRASFQNFKVDGSSMYPARWRTGSSLS
ncbi:MAG: hypothetical protein U5Q44_03090 [Dehalococcoidia bacterium]|nr:hypothetical protein [Dehalococcoidia bacterium]